MKKVYIYRTYERIWHWTQAVLTLFLLFTGFEIHSSYEFFGFQNAVQYHIVAAWLFIAMIAFTIFWHFVTREWEQFIPTRENLRAQFRYYISGIFHHAPHPHRKTQLSKLNPLQRLVYLGLMLFIIPTIVITGLLYMYYRYPFRGEMFALPIEGLHTVAILHTTGALLLVAFLVVHIYLITTGETPTSNLKAMITGYEDLEDESDSAESTPSTVVESQEQGA